MGADRVFRRYRTTRAAGAALSVSACVMAAAMAGPVQAQTVNDKWITIILPAEPADLDGCESSRESQGRVVKQNIVETLIEKNPADGTLKPRLATSWEQTAPDTWRIKLRPGVTFHDGSPFNAASAKRGLDRTLSKAIVCGNRTKFFGPLTLSISTPDDMTLEIKTSAPDPILPVRLASTTIVGPNTPLDRLVLDPVGTGPYVLQKWNTGTEVLLKRNDAYWGPKPAVEGVRYIWRDVSSVRAAMVKIGEADIALSIAEQDATDPKTDYFYLNSETAFLRIDMAVPPLNDRRVRLALTYGLDREALLKTIMPEGTVLATQMVVPGIPGHNHELDKNVLPYDPDKAKQLLAEAKADGVPVDKEILLLAYPARYSNAAEVMDAAFTMYTKIGFNMKMTTLEPGNYRKWSGKPFPPDRPPSLLQTSHDNNSGDPVFTMPLRYGCEGDSSTLCDPEFDKEIARISTLSGKQRMDEWSAMFKRLYEEINAEVFLFHMVGVTRVNPRIDWKPDISSNSEVRVQEINFVK